MLTSQAWPPAPVQVLHVLHRCLSVNSVTFLFHGPAQSVASPIAHHTHVQARRVGTGICEFQSTERCLLARLKRKHDSTSCQCKQDAEQHGPNCALERTASSALSAASSAARRCASSRALAFVSASCSWSRSFSISWATLLGTLSMAPCSQTQRGSSRRVAVLFCPRCLQCYTPHLNSCDIQSVPFLHGTNSGDVLKHA